MTNGGDESAQYGQAKLSSKELFQLEYNTVNTYILHYSTVRSALAAFLITVALGAFGGYYSTMEKAAPVSGVASTNASTAQIPPTTVSATSTAPGSTSASTATAEADGHNFLWVAGYVFLVAAVFASCWFSYLTERTTEYSKVLWKWGVRGEGEYPGGFRSFAMKRKSERASPRSPRQRVRAGVLKDKMNWLLWAGALGLAVLFGVFR